MADFEIRTLVSEDIPYLIRIDHSYHTDFAWQMEVNLDEKDVTIRFKEVRLPRSMRVDYPRNLENLGSVIEKRDLTYVALREGEIVGYASLEVGASQVLGIVSDIAVLRRFRKQGVGSALVFAVQSWLSKRGIYQIQLEMQSKNYPSIRMANKLGFEFCGYSDRYYSNQDIALFFGRRV
jgi:ribosomal protein S18 acetylase RimI-like enzyme